MAQIGIEVSLHLEWDALMAGSDETPLTITSRGSGWRWYSGRPFSEAIRRMGLRGRDHVECQAAFAIVHKREAPTFTVDSGASVLCLVRVVDFKGALTARWVIADGGGFVHVSFRDLHAIKTWWEEIGRPGDLMICCRTDLGSMLGDLVSDQRG